MTQYYFVLIYNQFRFECSVIDLFGYVYEELHSKLQSIKYKTNYYNRKIPAEKKKHTTNNNGLYFPIQQKSSRAITNYVYITIAHVFYGAFVHTQIGFIYMGYYNVMLTYIMRVGTINYFMIRKVRLEVERKVYFSIQF